MDLEDTLLMMPGPVPVSPRVLRAMSKPMINHRSAEFAGIYTDCRGILADVFQTKNNIFLLSGSGTAGMEAAVGSMNPAAEIGKLTKKYDALFIMDGVLDKP